MRPRKKAGQGHSRLQPGRAEGTEAAWGGPAVPRPIQCVAEAGEPTQSAFLGELSVVLGCWTRLAPSHQHTGWPGTRYKCSSFNCRAQQAETAGRCEQVMRVLLLPCKHSTPHCGRRQKASRSQHPKGMNATLHHPTACPTAPLKEHNPKQQTQRGDHFGIMPPQHVILRPRTTQPNEAIAPSVGTTPTHHPAAGTACTHGAAGAPEHCWLWDHHPHNATPPANFFSIYQN